MFEDGGADAEQGRKESKKEVSLVTMGGDAI